jgi:hypothetical protein
MFLLLLRNHDTNSKIEKLSADQCQNPFLFQPLIQCLLHSSHLDPHPFSVSFLLCGWITRSSFFNEFVEFFSHVTEVKGCNGGFTYWNQRGWQRCFLYNRRPWNGAWFCTNGCVWDSGQYLSPSE